VRILLTYPRKEEGEGRKFIRPLSFCRRSKRVVLGKGLKGGSRGQPLPSSKSGNIYKTSLGRGKGGERGVSRNTKRRRGGAKGKDYKIGGLT